MVSHSDGSHVHVIAPHRVHAVTQAYPHNVLHSSSYGIGEPKWQTLDSLSTVIEYACEVGQDTCSLTRSII